ncbi:helix-turn-helix domain-containing protein [Streptantibioticus silvisoli]|uniref:Helix-turn-helix domain-containing protein n=1 Tax=Streptantibioticus silvisoli TaxID=2705255 RepID=A0ABT6W4C5_9ACTN|nr:helix-turn-helix domain-containing protein [Streptantibioticus silvisoli]MDI5964817.1 helix-turn-helix domain-containing protein [Streptantibioticus silvisoli]
MARSLPPGLHLTLVDCARIDGVLVDALVRISRRDGGVPHDVEEVVALIHQKAAEFRTSVLVDGGSGTARDESGSVQRPLISTERLSTQEAAELTGVSDSYLRRLARRGDVQASQTGRRGEWVFDGSAVAAWKAGRDEVRQAG